MDSPGTEALLSSSRGSSCCFQRVADDLARLTGHAASRCWQANVPEFRAVAMFNDARNSKHIARDELTVITNMYSLNRMPSTTCLSTCPRSTAACSPGNTSTGLYSRTLCGRIFSKSRRTVRADSSYPKALISGNSVSEYNSGYSCTREVIYPR